jgi:hypothetical protein
MSHDVYISYHLENGEVTDSIYKKLEANKIGSWMVPISKNSEKDWSKSIVDAIKEANIFVLILSSKSNESPLTSKEVEMAKNYEKKIITFQLEDIETLKLDLIICDNIIDATKSTKLEITYDEDITKLVTEIESLLVNVPKKEQVQTITINDHSKAIAAISGLLVISLVVVGYLVPLPYNWLLILALLFVFFVLLGYTKGKWNRILVDERNQMSLSRFQTVVWTLIILSAFFAIALARIKGGTLSDALDIEVPWQLWAVIGISVTSLVGSPLILSTKKDLTIVDSEREKYINKLNEKNMNLEGTVCINQTIDQARFTDIFTGDEAADCRRIDMAKVQMFFFTIIVVVAYSILILQTMINASTTNAFDLLDFPLLSAGIIALLAISHGAYLTEKAVPSTPTES